MPMRQPLVFDRERSALLTTMVERACEEAGNRGLRFGASEQEARMILAGKMISAIERGETNPEKLEALAIQGDTPWQRAG